MAPEPTEPRSPARRTPEQEQRLRALGKRVSERRSALGMTLQDVVAAVGLHHSSLSRFERGEQDLGASNLKVLAEALDTDVESLFRD